MNERKLSEMKNNDNNNEYSVKVEGVEPYRRPIWQRFFSSAAAVAVMAGCVAAAAYMLPKMSSSNHLAAQAEEQTEEANAVTEAATEAAAETADTAVSAPLSNEEMKKLFEDNVNVYFEAAALSSDTNTDNSAEPIQFWRYWGEYDESLGDDFGMRREGDSLYYLATYYKVKEPRSNDINELKDYYSQYIYEPEREFGLGIDLSDCAVGSVIHQPTRYLDIIGYNGGIYSTQHIVTAMPVNEADRGEIICDKALYATDDSFTWERIYKVYNADIGGQTIPVKAESIQLDFEKLSDGSWKVTNGEVAGDEYNSTLDYYALDTVFSNAGGAYISSNMCIDFAKASNAVSDYITDVINRERAFYTLWERTDKLPENYEHITEDYIKDNNWLKFTYREAFTHDGPDVDIFTDSNGTIFAVAER